MKIKKNIYKKICDIGGCLNKADYYITYDKGGKSTDICKECIIKLYKELKKVIYDKQNKKTK